MVNSTIYLYVIGTYLLVLIAFGFVMARLVRSDADYFRCGSRGTWWLVGVSNFMSGFSAWTFTGAAGVAFEAGPSVILIGLGGVVGTFLILAPFLAGWFRQLRATTMPEVIRNRFGPRTQQFYAYINVPTRLLYSSLHLFGFAIFASTFFGWDIRLIIIAVGLTVTLYATFGGNWAATTTDFLQSMIVLSMTILVAVLCLQHVGGIGGMISLVQEKGLQSDFTFIKPDGQFSGNRYGWWWMIAMTVFGLMSLGNVAASPQFFSTKDGREAKRAALLGGLLGLAAQFLFYIPPMVARLTAADDVLGSSLKKPAESAYAVMSMKLLTPGLMAVMVVAMLAATMSAMDTGLNRNAAIITEDIYPALRRRLGRKEADGNHRMRLGQIMTAMLGIGIIILAMHFAGVGDANKGIFGIMLDINTTLTIPLMIPMTLCLFVKRVPSWTAIASAAVTMVPSLLGFFSKDLFGHEWTYQQKLFTTIPVGIAAFLLCGLSWRRETLAYHQQVDQFFTTMHTPVDFAAEVGDENDLRQLRIVGVFSVIVGMLMMLLVFLPDDWRGRIQVLCVSGGVCAVGALMIAAPSIKGRFTRRKTTTAANEPVESVSPAALVEASS